MMAAGRLTGERAFGTQAAARTVTIVLATAGEWRLGARMPPGPSVLSLV